MGAKISVHSCRSLGRPIRHDAPDQRRSTPAHQSRSVANGSTARGGARAQASVLLLRLAQICPKGNLLQPWFELAEALKNAALPAGSMIYGAVGVPADR